jgi:hypothetical protein
LTRSELRGNIFSMAKLAAPEVAALDPYMAIGYPDATLEVVSAQKPA